MKARRFDDGLLAIASIALIALVVFPPSRAALDARHIIDTLGAVTTSHDVLVGGLVFGTVIAIQLPSILCVMAAGLLATRIADDGSNGAATA